VDIAPIGFTPSEKADLLALLDSGLTDPRVLAVTGPFSRPKLRSEDPNFHLRFGSATAGSNGLLPQLVVDDPARLGSNWRIAIANGASSSQAWIGADTEADLIGSPFMGVRLHLGATHRLQIIGPVDLDATGLVTVHAQMPIKPFLLGRAIVLQAIIKDPGGPSGFSATAAVATPLLTAR
jgi:hypothetical protein